MEVISLLIYNKYFRDFDNWPLNRVWPVNGGPLNRGSAVFYYMSMILLRKYTKVTSFVFVS